MPEGVVHSIWVSRVDPGANAASWRGLDQGSSREALPRWMRSPPTTDRQVRDSPTPSIDIATALSRLKPQRCTLDIDGVRTTVDALLVEVLNIGSVGPNVTLALDADPSDGVLTVVTAGEEHRLDLDSYLINRVRGRDGVLSLPSRRARHVVVDGPGDLHVDDEVILSTGPVSVQIEPAALEVIV